MPLDALKNLPPIQDVLGHSAVTPLVSEHGRELVLSWIRDALQNARQLILSWSDVPRTSREHESNPLDRSGWTELMVEHVVQQARVTGQQQLSRVINATGVVLHTGLGRAPLSFAARQALVQLGVRDVSIIYDPMAIGAAGTVIGQSPVSGATMLPGASAQLRVAGPGTP